MDSARNAQKTIGETVDGQTGNMVEYGRTRRKTNEKVHVSFCDGTDTSSADADFCVSDGVLHSGAQPWHGIDRIFQGVGESVQKGGDAK